MATERRLIAYDPMTFESFTRHATKHIDPYYDPYGEGFTDAVDSIEGWLKNNTVDAVEVVRCKDCKHRKEKTCFHPFAGMWVGCELKDDDFCSYGERKDND